jgi:Ser/Thr protein kinase RdoA (MazF antagonist)
VSEEGWADLEAWRAARLGDALGGTMNLVREVEVEGRQRVARISRRTTDDLDWEISLLARLQSVGLDVPHLVPATDGRLRVGHTVVMERVEGSQPDGEDDWHRIVQYLGRLHKATVGWVPQRPGWLACTELVTETRSGPVDVSGLPPDVLGRCRRAWSHLPPLPRVVIHGDPNPTNIRVSGSRVVFLDWDEARIDSPLLDFAYVPDAESDLSAADMRAGRQAFYAWEAAMFWTISPDHAKRRLARID